MARFRAAAPGIVLLGLAVAALAEPPELLSRATEALGGAEALAKIRNVRLEGRLTAGNVVYRYSETWTDDAILCTWRTSEGEVSRGWDGAAGWIEKGAPVALPEDEALRLRQGLALRRLLLLRFPEDPVEEDGRLCAGGYRMRFGEDAFLESVALEIGEQQVTYTFSEYDAKRTPPIPRRWHISVADHPAAGATYRFSKVETNVEIPEGFFSRDARELPGEGR